MPIQEFQCIACMGTSIDFTIKAEASKDYIERINKLMQLQEQTTGIKRTFFDDLKHNKYPNGYVKVCASWTKRMWGQDKSVDSSILNFPTKMFDTCGAYDFKNGGAQISKGSEKSEWQNALDFLEWYGLPYMEGFGVIIIEDQAPNKYLNLPGSKTGEICFN